MDQIKILIVDDEWNMRNLLRVYLSSEEYTIIEAKNGNEALEIINQNTPDLIILDIMMPDMDGWEVCKKIRETMQIPILMLTARTDVKDRVHGLSMGADDYLTKPFAPEELVARVQALLRRVNISLKKEKEPTTLFFKDLTIDKEGRQVFVKDFQIELTPKEYDLIELLISNPKRVYSRDVLLSQIWGADSYRDDRTVDTHVKNVREKVRKAGLSFNPIKTIWGVGYKFQEPDGDS